MSRKDIKSRSDISGFSPREQKSKRKNTQKRILSKTNQKEYKPKFLISNKFLKNSVKSDHKKYRKRKTCTLADKMLKIQNNGLKIKKNKKFRKSANSRIIRKSFAAQFFNTTSKNQMKNQTERNHINRNLFDSDYDFMKESNDSFVLKSMNRLVNLEDLETMIKKTKKQIRKSTSKCLCNLKILTRFE